MCIHSESSSTAAAPQTNGDKLAAWVAERFEAHREALGYPSDKTIIPGFLVTNDLVGKLLGLIALAVEHKIPAALEGLPQAYAYFFRAYKEPKTTSCSYWFSIPFESFKDMPSVLEPAIEMQKKAGNDDVVEMLTAL